MKHLYEAASGMPENLEDYIIVDEQSHSVTFQIQDGPIKEVGVNGCQAVDMLEFTGRLFKSLNEAFPCEENEQTLFHILEAVRYQDERTADREKRGVEGKSEA